MKKKLLLPPVIVLIVLLAMLPTFLPSAVELKGARARPGTIAYSTANPGFETGIGGWEVKLNEGDMMVRSEEGYRGNFSISFRVVNGSGLELAEPTEYLPLNDTLCLTVAAKDLRPLAENSYLEVDVLAFWSWKRIIPVHLIIRPGLNATGTLTYVDESGIYIVRGAKADGWTEYRLRLGSYAIRELLVEFLKRAYNETLAKPSDEFFIRFIYVRPHNLEGYVDQVGMGYLRPGTMTLSFESRSLLPMSAFVSKVVSQGEERPFIVEGSYSFTITYVEPIVASSKISVEVDFSTGQRVLANITVSQPRVLWV